MDETIHYIYLGVAHQNNKIWDTFQSLRIVYNLVNSVNPNYAAFHLGLHCLLKYPFTGFQHNIRIHHEFEGGIVKSVPRITVWHHEACRVMTNGDPEGRIFISHPHTNNGYFFLAQH